MSSKLKVLQVIPRLGYGGAEIGCYDLAHYLKEQKSSSFIATSGGELLKYIDKKKVKLFRLPVQSKNPLLILINIFILTFIVLFYKINILHVRSRAPAWSCYYVSKITRCKLVTTFHGTYNFNSSLKKMYNSVMVRSDLIIAGSNFIFNHISENYAKYLNRKKKLMVIFRGINLDFFSRKNISQNKRNSLVKEWNLDQEKLTILLPGRLTKWKGQEMFIESLNILREDYNSNGFRAIILGSNQGRNVYSKKLYGLVDRYRLKNFVKFINHCKEMPLAYSLADVVVSASTSPEAFGRVSVEAQAMGKPIIASNIGGSKQTILKGKSGFLYNHDDPRELAKTINTVIELDQDSLNSIGNEGRKNATKKFDVESMCDSTLREYKKLLNI